MNIDELPLKAGLTGAVLVQKAVGLVFDKGAKKKQEHGPCACPCGHIDPQSTE